MKFVLKTLLALYFCTMLSACSWMTGKLHNNESDSDGVNKESANLTSDKPEGKSDKSKKTTSSNKPLFKFEIPEDDPIVRGGHNDPRFDSGFWRK